MFSYENGRYCKDNKPFFVRGVEYQYYRDKKEHWQDRLQKLFASHANVVTFYIPWRHHITGNCEYDFTGQTQPNRDLIGFIELCTKEGFYMIAKPGPFVHSELNIGGLANISSPSFNQKITPACTYKKPLCWEYDNSLLPSPNDKIFDDLAYRWLKAVAKVLEKFVAPKGNIIGVQLNDETVYCTSNDAPWNFGYDAPCLKFYQQLLKQQYSTIENYNDLHQTSFSHFAQVKGPAFPPSCIENLSQLKPLIDWGEYQWKLRREIYARYKKYLSIELPHLSNLAGITPPIIENIPGKEIPEFALDEFSKLYPEWWFATNRIEADLDVYEYGMISWLGVAAYNISDTQSTQRDNPGNDVFNRYINTARRRRGINMEENWGFAKLYHPFSKYPIVPFFQTLACVAGGCTGYVVFCGVQHGYWDDSLDQITKKQQATFPSDAPITSQGELTPMYKTMKMMNQWFAWEGDTYLQAEMQADICCLIYPPYAAISGWIPGAKYWKLPYEIPRCGVDIEVFAMNIQERGYIHEMVDLTAIDAEVLQKKPVCAIHLGFFMDRKTQAKLLHYVHQGGTLLCCGERPLLDEQFAKYSAFSEIEEGEQELKKGKIYFATKNFFTEVQSYKTLLKMGIYPKVSHSKGIRVFVYRHQEDYYVWFFNFEQKQNRHFKKVEFYGKTLQLTLGAKTSGVVHLRKEKIMSVLVKGKNELEKRECEVEICYQEQSLKRCGDWIFRSFS